MPGKPGKIATKTGAACAPGPKRSRKFIRVSPRKQITIPQSFYEALGFGDEAECILEDGSLRIRPVREAHDESLDDLLLADLIQQGLGGKELLNAFKERRAKLRPAVEAVIEEADDIAKGQKKGASRKDVFPEYA